MSIDDILNAIPGSLEKRLRALNDASILDQKHGLSSSYREDEIKKLRITLETFQEEQRLYSPLLEFLKSDNPEERKDAIRKLGQLKTERAIRALVYIAEGNFRKYTDRTWKTLWIKIALKRYGGEDQFEAVAALKTTGDNRADKYAFAYCLSNSRPVSRVFFNM